MTNYITIDIDFWEKMSFKQKITYLLENKVFYVDEEDLEDFNDLIDLYSQKIAKEKSNYNVDSYISQISYLKWEVDTSKHLKNVILKATKPKKYFFHYDLLEIHESYLSDLQTSDSFQLKKDLIAQSINKLNTTLTHFWNFELSEFSHLDKLPPHKAIEIILDKIYCSPLYNDLDFIDESPNKLCDVVRKDLITALYTSTSAYDHFEMAHYVMRLIAIHKTLIDMKSEYQKNEIAEKHFKGENLMNESNLNSNENRYPFVFKDSFSCELFITMTQQNHKILPIDFSYYFDIFLKNKHFIKNIKYTNYKKFTLDFYGIKLDRRRDNLSNEKYNDFINIYIKSKKAISHNNLKTND
ncbi:hypothetical protein LRR18_00750 [Mangrovimonas sp. AS39]|uniref:hypothetical protein n=1 Tax=Mangrovimonas futianensis TaxID=2895523 RepID=UPI001E3BFB8A|nr:hypothetical protein [Mangrovimonas futianensis]MCF1190095.1 hypothetical protein [Mangrovimonas futianensis]MCF1194154.1 hypothetical protein [Mangrovimonas futianensis]